MIAETINYYSNILVLEWIAVITAFAYVIFAAKENILCWPAALISTALYTIVFYEFYLWMDSVLQVYYFAMAIYGWICWKSKNSKNELLAISSKSLSFHLIACALLAVCSLLVGYFMDNHTPTTFPYIDAATTVFAVFATYLVTQKVLENWLYWVVIDLISIYVYLEKGLAPTAMLFIFYVFFALFGYLSWLKKHRQVLVAA